MNSLADHFRRLFEYEKNSQEKVLASLVAAGNGTGEPGLIQRAVDMMGHVVAARRMWLWRIGFVDNRPDGVFPKEVTLQELEGTMLETHSLWREYFAMLDDAELARSIDYKTLDGRPFSNRVEEMLIQLHGHSMYHLGQIAAWIREAGAEPAPIDFILWTRESQTS